MMRLVRHLRDKYTSHVMCSEQKNHKSHRVVISDFLVTPPKNDKMS
jgi:hypothetical protein